MTTRAATTIFSRESELHEPVQRYLRGRAFQMQDSEVQFYEQRIDIYAYSESRELTVAVELKLERWSRAIEQALLYQLCADFVYVAVPATTAPRVDRSRLAAYGIGLLAVDRRGCQEVIRPRQSPVTKRYYRAEYVSALQGSDQ